MTSANWVVVGQGLAGTAVAWHLRWRGCRVVMIDRDDPDSASRVAAGLVTPVTGKRLARTPRYDEFYPAAVAFYRRVEAETGRPVFTTRNAVRLFADDAERAKLDGRTVEFLANGPASAGRAEEPRPADAGPFAGSGGLRPPLARHGIVNPDWFTNPHGGFEMAPAGRLDVPAYLDSSRAFFAVDGGFAAADLDPVRDIEPEPDGVRLPRLGVRAKGVIFCQGFAGRSNPWFPALPFNPAKGEVLTLRVPGLTEDRVIHRGVWLAPAGGDVYHAGSTYNRDDLTPTPTVKGGDEILSKLRAFLRLPVEVIDHRAGVRPVVDVQRPVFGVHPDYPRLAYFNGLGSKGVLTAPFAAAELANALVTTS